MVVTIPLLIAPLMFQLAGAAEPPNVSASWPQFRGPDGQGHADTAPIPLHWSESEGITWKVPVPGKGWSSPVTTGDQIWLTTAVDDGRALHALCFDLRTGRTIHDAELFRDTTPEPVHAKNSHATPTPVIDDDRVYVHFGASGTACLSTTGEVLWKNSTLQYQQPYSGASSPIVADNLLILTCDGTDSQFLAALDKRTGDVVWKRPRQHLAAAKIKAKSEPSNREGFPLMAYSTPLRIDVGGRPQLVSTAADHVAAYDPLSGEEIWWFVYDGFSLVARPVYGHGLVYVVGFEQQSRPVLYAIRPEHRGEIGAADLAWSYRENVCHVPSPLVVGDRIFMINDAGIATCLNAITGQLVWRHRVGGNYSASPSYAGGKVLLVSEESKATLLAIGSRFEPIAVNQLDGSCMASPAIADNALFLRSDTHLYRIDSQE